jgi:predicted nucleic acid-binding protein
LWQAVQANTARVVVSEFSILECLVMPYRRSDPILSADYENLFTRTGVDLSPITATILRRAAQLRASQTRLRSPDAIHAATALEVGAVLFVTNDTDFRNVPGLPVTVL